MLAYSSHIFHRYEYAMHVCVVNSHTYVSFRTNYDGSFLAVVTVYAVCRLSFVSYESFSCLLSRAISIVRFLSFFSLLFFFSSWIYRGVCVCECLFVCTYTHFRHHYRVVVSVISYSVSVVKPRIQFEWWFYAQSDFILSEVVLFSFYFIFLHFEWLSKTGSSSSIITRTTRKLSRKESNAFLYFYCWLSMRLAGWCFFLFLIFILQRGQFKIMFIQFCKMRFAQHARQWFIWSQIVSTHTHTHKIFKLILLDFLSVSLIWFSWNPLLFVLHSLARTCVYVFRWINQPARIFISISIIHFSPSSAVRHVFYVLVSTSRRNFNWITFLYSSFAHLKI